MLYWSEVEEDEIGYCLKVCVLITLGRKGSEMWTKSKYVNAYIFHEILNVKDVLLQFFAISVISNSILLFNFPKQKNVGDFNERSFKPGAEDFSIIFCLYW